MPRRRWKLHGFITTVALSALLVAVWSCSGGGEGGVGPTAPQSPLPQGDFISLSGRYYGVSNLKSASGCGCVAEVAQAWLNGEDGHRVVPRGEQPINFFEWEIEQLNTAIEGTIFLEWQKGLAGPGWCAVEGAKPNYMQRDSLFSADTVRCEQDPVRVACANGLSRDLALESLHWEGRFEGRDELNFGDWTGTFICRDSGNGDAIGSLVLRGVWIMDNTD